MAMESASASPGAGPGDICDVDTGAARVTLALAGEAMSKQLHGVLGNSDGEIELETQPEQPKRRRHSDIGPERAGSARAVKNPKMHSFFTKKN